MPQPKDKDWMNGYKNKTAIYAVYKKPPQNKEHIQTESEGLEIPGHLTYLLRNLYASQEATLKLEME